MEKLQQLYEGKAKKVFATNDPEKLIVEYKDDATAFNGLKKGTIKGKGVSFMENAVEWHGKGPNDEEYAIAMQELNAAYAALEQEEK